jgi:hypothetical protein
MTEAQLQYLVSQILGQLKVIASNQTPFPRINVELECDNLLVFANDNMNQLFTALTAAKAI